MYTLKSIARRGTALVAVFALAAATLVPTAPAFADALNPLTERSLLLTSSAPGFVDTDGSGNSFAAPNAIGENYAPAGSGPNGKKSGETFTFKVSSTATVRGFSLQYCQEAAGVCKAPGNNSGDARDPDDAGPLEGDRMLNGDAHILSTPTSDLDFVGNFAEGTTAGTFEVRVDGATSTGWTISKANLEDDAHSEALTGTFNYITLTKTAGDLIENGEIVQIIFRPSETIYITNPGADAFFVKINTYSSATSLLGIHNEPVEANHTVIDGGVTVANVMTDSIHITTKVLETMAFSVGTQNPDTVNLGAGIHGMCDPINVVNNNRLNMGNPNAEYSLETDTAYDTYSFWRLSSNSSGGATVYYSGDTLANTVGDSISAIGTTVGTPTGSKDKSHPGTEQFGLALVSPVETSWGTGSFDPAWVTPSYAPLTVHDDYNDGDGEINEADWNDNAEFAFNSDSLTTPVLIASDNDDVVDCATAKIRYVANIAASTPAGVYTTKINYLAAPQY